MTEQQIAYLPGPLPPDTCVSCEHPRSIHTAQSYLGRPDMTACTYAEAVPEVGFRYVLRSGCDCREYLDNKTAITT